MLIPTVTQQHLDAEKKKKKDKNKNVCGITSIAPDRDVIVGVCNVCTLIDWRRKVIELSEGPPCVWLSDIIREYTTCDESRTERESDICCSPVTVELLLCSVQWGMARTQRSRYLQFRRVGFVKASTEVCPKRHWCRCVDRDPRWVGKRKLC